MDQQEKLPFLLSAPLKLFNSEMNDKKYRGAVLAIKDCWEALLKLLGITLYTDAINHIYSMDDKDCPHEFLEILSLLFSKPPANGDWLNFYVETAKFIQNNEDADRLVFPELANLVCRAGDLRLNKKTMALFRGFVEWRNCTIGHSIISHDIESVRSDIEQQYERLMGLLQGAPFLWELEMYSIGPNSEKVGWNRDDAPEIGSAISLKDRDFIVWIKRDEARQFSLSPLIIAGTVKNAFTLLTFDMIRNGYVFLDYFYGTKVRFPRYLPIESWIGEAEHGGRIRFLDNLGQSTMLDSAAETYSGDIVKSFEMIEFGSEIKKEFINPEYLVREIESALKTLDEESGRGYIHIVGEAGSGKSWLAYALEKGKTFFYSKSVVRYHIRIGMRQNANLFLAHLQDQVKRIDGHFVFGGRFRFEEFLERRDAVRAFIQETLENSNEEYFILVIDGLDELLEPEEDNPSILDFLPYGQELPDATYIILLSRDEGEIRKNSIDFINNLKKGPYRSIRMESFENERRALFARYLRDKCKITNERLIEVSIINAGSSFLLLSLYGKLYYGDTGSSFLELPSTLKETYAAYFDTLQNQIGKLLFSNLYIRIILALSISPYPLGLNQLSDLIGAKAEKIVFALFDLGQFFNVFRETSGNSFTLVHLQLAEFIYSRYANEIKVLMQEILETYEDDKPTLGWCVDSNEMLQILGATELSIYFSENLLNKVQRGTREWLRTMVSYVDMIHIQGNYRQAALMYHHLAEESIAQYRMKRSDSFYIHCKIREAHHLKFIEDISLPKKILEGLLQDVKNGSEEHLEILFMLHGSIASLEDPTDQSLENLIKVAESARNQGLSYLLSRCLRRISGFYLLEGRAQMAKVAVEDAKRIVEREHSRQRIYLYSTEGEIYRFEGNLERSRICHVYTLQQAEEKGLNGWAGHASLGMAEIYRMWGDYDNWIKYIQYAENYYRLADDQAWGMVHLNISKFLVQGDPLYLNQALEKSKAHGYLRDIRYIESLSSREKVIDPVSHCDHFLLFP
jgi:archaellum biogenesis ATPase FlaH